MKIITTLDETKEFDHLIDVVDGTTEFVTDRGDDIPSRLLRGGVTNGYGILLLLFLYG